MRAQLLYNMHSLSIFYGVFSNPEYRKFWIIRKEKTEGGNFRFLWDLHDIQLLHCNNQYFWDNLIIFPTKSPTKFNSDFRKLQYNLP